MAIVFPKCIGIYLFWREFIVGNEISHRFRIFPYLSKFGRYTAIKLEYLVKTELFYFGILEFNI